MAENGNKTNEHQDFIRKTTSKLMEGPPVEGLKSNKKYDRKSTAGGVTGPEL